MRDLLTPLYPRQTCQGETTRSQPTNEKDHLFRKTVRSCRRGCELSTHAGSCQHKQTHKTFATCTVCVCVCSDARVRLTINTPFNTCWGRLIRGCSYAQHVLRAHRHASETEINATELRLILLMIILLLLLLLLVHAHRSRTQRTTTQIRHFRGMCVCVVCAIRQHVMNTEKMLQMYE